MTPASAFGNGAPTLNEIDAAYGKNAGAAWLMPQLFSVGEFAGVREKMDEQQTLELAMVIRARYGFLTVTELMYFFFNLKAGKYGKFYGVVDPMVITEALGVFLNERNLYLTDVENQRKRAERDAIYERTDALTPEQVRMLRDKLEKKWREEEQAAGQRCGEQ